MASRSTRPSVNRRLRRPSSADYLLEVTTRSSSARRRRRQRALGWSLRIVFLLVLGVASFYGVRAAFDRFFYSNPDYTLERIDFALDGVMSREEALAASGLREGGNIFAVNLQVLEQTFQAIPMVQEVRIERALPDRIAVTLRARQPVAWVSASNGTEDPSTLPSSFLIDASGVLMKPRRILPEYLALPAIYGVDPEILREGEPLQTADLQKALELISELALRPDSLLRIRAMDLSRGFRIAVTNDEHATILFGTKDLDEQLDRLQTLLLHCAESGRSLETVNLMVRRNTPVTFAMAASSPHETQESGKKNH